MKYGEVLKLTVFDDSPSMAEVEVAFRVERAVMHKFIDALKPIDPSAKREPIQAILECSAPDTPVPRVIVSDEERDCATGFCTCGNCGNPIDPWDGWCRHCGAELEDA